MTTDKPQSSISLADAEYIDRPGQGRLFPDMSRREAMNQQHQDIANYAHNHCAMRLNADPVTDSEIDLLEKLHDRIGSALEALKDGRE